MSLQSLSTQKDIKLFHDDIVSPQIIKAAQSHLSYSYYVESGLVTSNVTCTFVCFNKKLATTLNKNLSFFLLLARPDLLKVWSPYLCFVFVWQSDKKTFAHSFRGMSCYVNFVWKPGKLTSKNATGLVIEFGIVHPGTENKMFWMQNLLYSLWLKVYYSNFGKVKGNKSFTICWFSAGLTFHAWYFVLSSLCSIK